KRLRRWRRELSRVRNYDVFLILLEKEAAAVHDDHRQPFELMREVLQQRRAATAAKVCHYLIDKSVSQLAHRLGLGLPDDAQMPTKEGGNESKPGEGSNATLVTAPTLVIDEARLAS